MFTPVIFRFDEKAQEVVAIFPSFGDTHMNTMTCYVRVGQHSLCDYGWYLTTRGATPEEYKDLLEELVSIGYDNLKIYTRIQPWMREAKLEDYLNNWR